MSDSDAPRPWIRIIPESEAAGKLKEHYDGAVKRAGKVFNIIKIQSLRADFIDISMQMYRVIMFGPSGLTRAERELAATVVSAVNHCHYWTRAHADDLASEARDPVWAAQVRDHYKNSGRTPRESAIIQYAEKLTLTPAAMGPADLELLRSHAMKDEDILTLTQVVAYFNYINRIADALGVPDEPEWELP